MHAHPDALKPNGAHRERWGAIRNKDHMIAAEDCQLRFRRPDLHPYQVRRSEGLTEDVAQRRVQRDLITLPRNRGRGDMDVPPGDRRHEPLQRWFDTDHGDLIE